MEEDKAEREAATSLISLKYEKNIINEIHDLSAELDFKETQKSKGSEIFKSTTSSGKDAKRGTKHVLESDDRRIISKGKIMQAGKRTSEPQITEDKSHLLPGTGTKNFTAAETQKMQTKHPPDRSNQKKEIGNQRNDTMIGKRVMMLMNGVRCYGTVTGFKRSYEVLFDNGMTEEFLRCQVEAAVVKDEAAATSACKKYKANSDI